MFGEEIISVANDSVQADRLAIESAVKECYEQHKAAWESWDKGEAPYTVMYKIYQPWLQFPLFHIHF